jgi:hypothetical protein
VPLLIYPNAPWRPRAWIVPSDWAVHQQSQMDLR